MKYGVIGALVVGALLIIFGACLLADAAYEKKWFDGYSDDIKKTKCGIGCIFSGAALCVLATTYHFIYKPIIKLHV